MIGRGPVIVSFCSGEAYYEQAAQLLREDCARLGLDHDIVQLDATDWLDACRRKVSFYLEMHRKHRRPIFWIDVDSRLARYPECLDGATCDIAGFLRGFRYLRDFDPQTSPRFFAPFALYFNATPAATAFLELMAELEGAHEGAATDDFFLHEAWKQHRRQLSVMVLPPELVGREWPLTGDQAIYVGISGNVTKFKGRAEQHTAPIFAPAHRKAVLLHEAESALKAGNTGDALVLFRAAFAVDPDEALSERMARLERRGIRSSAGPTVGQEPVHNAAGISADTSKEPFWRRWLSSMRSG